MPLPLAARMRPETLDEFIGQEHLLSSGKPLQNAILGSKLHSMILWGPPGVGKTTLAKILANGIQAEFIGLSAVMAGIKEVRSAMERATENKEKFNKQTVLFIDEVHRFNKGQQDAFLPFVEQGTVIFIGATTENPSFEINNALLSRCRTYVLKALSDQDMIKIIERAIADPLRGFGSENIIFDDSLKLKLALSADGDGRQVLNMLELLLENTPLQNNAKLVEESVLTAVITGNLRRFDKGGENFYDQISGLHKSVRGSSPDGALYWFTRMLDGGCDPLYIARRVVRMASEDIGNADPRALTLALNAWDVQERLGSPEGELALAQAIVYLALAPKSNAVYTAFKASMNDAKNNGSLSVPLHLRNAPTALMRSLNYGADYRYDHDEEDAIAAGQTYFPEEMGERSYYHPVARGLEIKLAEKLQEIRNIRNTNNNGNNGNTRNNDNTRNNGNTRKDK